MKWTYAICLVSVRSGRLLRRLPVTPKPPKASREFVETPAQADEPLAEQFSLINAAHRSTPAQSTFRRSSAVCSAMPI